MLSLRTAALFGRRDRSSATMARFKTNFLETRKYSIINANSSDKNSNIVVPRSKPLSLDTIKSLPKAELHQHLDGSVRTSTILDLAYEQVTLENRVSFRCWFFTSSAFNFHLTNSKNYIIWYEEIDYSGYLLIRFCCALQVTVKGVMPLELYLRAFDIINSVLQKPCKRRYTKQEELFFVQL